jgi:hypothetical protein
MERHSAKMSMNILINLGSLLLCEALGGLKPPPPAPPKIGGEQKARGLKAPSFTLRRGLGVVGG